MKFRKRPVEVEAIQWTGRNAREVKRWINDQCARHRLRTLNEFVALFITRRDHNVSNTLWLNIADDDWSDDITAAVYDYLHETYVGVKDGQWIICGIEGEFSPHDADLFKIAYDPVEEA